MKLNQLRDFIAIADHGSLRGAARHLGASAPALVKSVALLEQELHVPLLVRGSRGVRLTEYGRALLQRARLIDSQAQQITEEMAQLRGSLEGSVTLGASPTPGVILLPDALGDFHKAFPAVRVNVVGGLYQAHVAAIRSGQMDFAITATPAEGLDGDLQGEDLFHNDLVIAARRGHPLARARSLSQLVDSAWVVTGPDTQGPGASILEAFRRQGLAPPRRVAQCDLTWTLHSLLLKSDMLCALPRLFFEHLGLAPRLQTIDIDEPLPHYRITLIQRADVPLLPTAAQLATLLRRHAVYLSREHPQLTLEQKAGNQSP